MRRLISLGARILQRWSIPTPVDCRIVGAAKLSKVFDDIYFNAIDGGFRGIFAFAIGFWHHPKSRPHPGSIRKANLRLEVPIGLFKLSGTRDKAGKMFSRLGKSCERE